MYAFMKRFISLLIIIFRISQISGQQLSYQQEKQPIDTSVFDKWPSVEHAEITNNGCYVLYFIKNRQIGKKDLLIQSIKGKWKKEVAGAHLGTFSDDSKKVLFINQNDSLCIQTLSNNFAEYIPSVRTFKLFKIGNAEWLFCLRNTSDKRIILKRMAVDKTLSFRDVNEYLISPSGKILILKTEFFKNGKLNYQLTWNNLVDEKSKIIWKGTDLGTFVLDRSETQLSFIVSNKDNNQNGKSIWYYKFGADTALEFINSKSTEIGSKLMIEEVVKFSNDGCGIFIQLKGQKSESQATNYGVKLDIWSYTDVKLQSRQLQGLEDDKYLAVININNKCIIRLQYDNEHLQFGENADDYGFIIKEEGDFNEVNWNRRCEISYFIISTKTGKRQEMQMRISGLSPEGKYALLIDSLQRNYFSYNVETGLLTNITKSLTIPLFDVEYDLPGIQPRGLLIAGWLPNDTAVLMYDKFDVWLIYLDSNRPPINLTNGYGRKENIRFRFTKDIPLNWFSKRTKIILSAFNQNTKENGFYSIKFDGNPEQLSMGSFVYYIDLFHGFSPKKARDAQIYLIRRESVDKSPNYFYTSDFKNYIQLSNVHPEESFNWATSELISWKTFDGRFAMGILYKPQNFNPKNKYPIIFDYYEKRSDEKNMFQFPEAAKNRINIPWFVSNGYLVFTPDIHFTIGAPGQSVYNYVVSAAKYMSKFSWIDTLKMGIQGHSFGGFETYYLITHTNIFAAACGAAGTCDFVSSYGALTGDGWSNKFFYETSQYRIGTTLWENRDLYIKNSPIFFADKVTTPLLMMHNKGDKAVPFEQGVEFFTALRRLGKKVWMLQYDEENHSIRVVSKEAAKDYTLRMTQFFDHYLKDSLAPKWMTKGVRANCKGVETGFELDYNIKSPVDGLLIKD